MLCRLLILLMLCSPALAVTNSALVGGSSAALTNCPFFDLDKITAAQNHKGGGAVIISASSVTYTNGTTTFSQTDIGVDVLDGMYAFCDGTNITAGYYEITSFTDDTIVCSGITATGDNSDSDVIVGGAVPALGGSGVGDYALQEVLDDNLTSAAASHSKIFVYDGGSLIDVTTGIDVSTGGGSGINRKWLIGCDSDYARLPQGSVAMFDPGVDDINDHIFNITVLNVTFQNIGAKNPAGSGGTPGTSEDCFKTSSHRTIFDQCYAERGYQGFEAAGGGHLALNCVSINMLARHYDYGNSNGGGVIGSYGIEGSLSATVDGMTMTGQGNYCINSVFVGGEFGVSASSSAGGLIQNCSFIGQSRACVAINNANANPQILNNIMDVVDTASDFAIEVLSGNYYEDWNITDADDATQSGFLNTNSAHNLTFTNTDPWVSISGEDFKPARGQAIADTYVIDVGMDMLFNSTTVATQLSRGAFPTYDLPAKNKVESSDTVYGETGTSAGGGGGGGQPVINGAIVR